MDHVLAPVLALGPAGILTWIVVGLIVGVIAKLLMPGDDPGGALMTILLGIAGAWVGGWLSGCIFGRGYDLQRIGDLGTKGGLVSLGIAVGGALLLLLLYRLIAGRRD